MAKLALLVYCSQSLGSLHHKCMCVRLDCMFREHTRGHKLHVRITQNKYNNSFTAISFSYSIYMYILHINVHIHRERKRQQMNTQAKETFKPMSQIINQCHSD